MAKKKDLEIKTDNFYEQKILTATEDPAAAVQASESEQHIDREQAAEILAKQEQAKRVKQLAEYGDEVDAIPERVKKKYKDRRQYNDTEAAVYMNSYDTRGKKGLALPRASLSFTPQVREYIRVMARATGKSESRFVDEAMRRDMERNIEIYSEAKELDAKLNGVKLK